MDDYDEQDDEALKQFLGTTSFGKTSRQSNVQVQIDQSKRQVQVQEKGVKDVEAKGESDEDDDGSDEDDSDDEDEFPVSHELIVKTHDKPVTTVTLDPSGTRMITGSNDCTLKLHDFASMTPTTVRAFKSVDPTSSKTSANVETHPIHQVLFNPISPSQVMVIAALPQAKFMDRNGDIYATTVKGDMYLRDMHNTKGHVSEITCGAWHPTDPNLCVTAGTDSTLRIWDVNNMREQKQVITVKSRAAGSAGRTRVTAVAWRAPSHGGENILVAAAYDGSLTMWVGEGPFNRPTAEIKDAHRKDTWTGGIDISSDGRLIVTRGGDDTIKLWDTKKFKTAINTVAHTSTSSQYPTTNIRFSPKGSNIITGSADGNLHILNPATLRPELVTPVTPGSPLISVLWHAKLNQIITCSANASTHILYSPDLSTAGAKTVMLKAPKRRHIDDDPNLTMDLSQGISGEGAQPGARHPQTGLTASGKSRDPRRPHIPATTPFAKSQPDEKHVRESFPLSRMREEDPREALLKYANKEGEKQFTSAWAKTQPKTIYADLSEEEEDERPDKKKVKR